MLDLSITLLLPSGGEEPLSVVAEMSANADRDTRDNPVRIPTKPAMHSNSKPAGYSDLKPATRGVVRMGQIHDVVEGWEGQETGWS